MTKHLVLGCSPTVVHPAIVDGWIVLKIPPVSVGEVAGFKLVMVTGCDSDTDVESY